jgi:putative flippase GtrA
VKFAKYVAVQVVAYGVDMGSFLLLAKVANADLVLANIGAKAVAGCFAFLMHRHFTFEAHANAPASSQAARYFITLACNIPLSAGFMKALLYVMGPPWLAKLISDIANVVLTYWVSKMLIFGARRDRRPG